MQETVESLKKCSSCNEKKSISEYYFRKETGKHKNVCKHCCIHRSKIQRNPTHKKCKHCDEWKPFSEYQKAGGGRWLQPYCKPCDRIRKAKHTEQNIETIKIKKKQYYYSNRKLVSPEQKAISKIKCIEAIKKAAKEYNEKRIKLTPEEKKIRKAETAKRFRERHKERILQKKREYNKRVGLQKKKEWQAKMMNNIEFRLTKNLRGRIYVALKRGIKSAPTMELLGCTIEYFKEYIESKFSDGMNWGNQGRYGWHIDHILPCDSFDLTKESEQRRCFHYSNMQPLWGVDNLKKGNKLNYKIAS